MDFELPEELRLFKDTLRRFVNTELIPIERQTVTAEGEEIKPEFLERFRKRAKDLGIWRLPRLSKQAREYAVRLGLHKFSSQSCEGAARSQRLEAAVPAAPT